MNLIKDLLIALNSLAIAIIMVANVFVEGINVNLAIFLMLLNIYWELTKKNSI